MYSFISWVQTRRDVQVRLKLQLTNAVEALLEVRLHSQGVLGFRQNLQKLIIRQEVESRERLQHNINRTGGNGSGETLAFTTPGKTPSVERMVIVYGIGPELCDRIHMDKLK